MAPIRTLVAAILLLAAQPAHADAVDRWRPYIDEAAARFGVPADWIVRVMRAESGGRTELDGRPITSRAGAMGLMQLMPGTWADMRSSLELGADPHDPRDNILAGTRYLRLMYDRFGYPGCFAAYNAGPARYAAYLVGRSRLPGETVAYAAAIATVVPLVPPEGTAAAPASIFFHEVGTLPDRPQGVPRRNSPLFFAIGGELLDQSSTREGSGSAQQQ